MKIRIYFFIGIYFLLIARFNCQISFSEIPQDLQLIPRNTSNIGSFNITGNSAFVGYNTIRSQIIDNSNLTIIEDKLTPIDPSGNFSVSHQIIAALKEYNLKIFIKQGSTEVLVKTVNDLVCGDVFIIAGQSNAQAGANGDLPSNLPVSGGNTFNSLYSNQFCRSIGGNIDFVLQQESAGVQQSADFQFGRPSCIWWDNYFSANQKRCFVGGWALKMQNDLANQTGIPSCIINGAMSGSNINYNQASNTPSNTNSLNLNLPYDRLYKKLYINNLTNAVKGIFWYQGESDGLSDYAASCDYINKFDKLYNSWKHDYPSFEKIFLFQINTGCSDNYSYKGLIREIQRRISQKYDDIIPIATIGNNSTDRLEDNCHYTLQGLENLGTKVAPIAKKYIYNFVISDNDILPPNIIRAYVSAPNQICLEFDKDIFVQSPNILKDYFYDESGSSLNLNSVQSNNNNAYLNFNNNQLPSKITYLPSSYNNSNTLYLGPWIMNSLNTMGALSFFEFPVTGPNNNGWIKTWSNYGSSKIEEQQLNTTDLFYTGDFDGGGDEELLCVQNTNGNNDIITLFKYDPVNLKWTKLWSNNGNPSAGNGIYNYRNNLIKGDFDGDGLDELIGNGSLQQGGWTTLFRFNNGNWQWIWSDYGNNNHAMWYYKDKFYSGDFNGDGIDEILGCGLGYGGWTTIFQWNGSDFVWGYWSDFGDLNDPIRNYRPNLILGDYNADSKTDLVGFGNSSSQHATLFTLTSNNWTPLWSTAGNNHFSGWNYPLHPSDVVLSGNIDNDGRDELIFLQNSPSAEWATTMDYYCKKGLGCKFFWNWSGNPIAPNFPFIDDWQIKPPLGSTDTKYLLIKAKTNEPSHLLAMRNQGCGYLANMYKVNNPNGNYKTNTTITKNIKPTLNNENHFKVYPNPANEFIIIQLPDSSLDHKIIITDLNGKTLFEMDYYNQHSIRIDCKYLVNGLYLLKIQNKNQIETHKIIVTK